MNKKVLINFSRSKKTIKISKAELHEPILIIWKKALTKVINSTYVSSKEKNKWVFKFFEKIIKCKYVIPVINGISFRYNFKSFKGWFRHEVLLPTLSCGHWECNFISKFYTSFRGSESSSLGVDPNKLEVYLRKICKITKKGCLNIKTKKIIKCLIITHVFGHSARIKEIKKVCKLFKLILIEDAAEGLGTLYDGIHVGNFGLLSALSFNGNKIITTGGGGAILTNNKRLFELARHISSTAKVNHEYEYIHDQPGYNYRLPHLFAALGCAQLKSWTFSWKKESII